MSPLKIALLLVAFSAGCEYGESLRKPSGEGVSGGSNSTKETGETGPSAGQEPVDPGTVKTEDKALTTDPAMLAKSRTYEQQVWDQRENFKAHVTAKLGNTVHWKDYSSPQGWALYHTLSDLYSLAWAIDVTPEASRRSAYAALGKEFLDVTLPILEVSGEVSGEPAGACSSEEYAWPHAECPYYQKGEGGTGGYACSKKQCVLRYLDEAHAAGGAGFVMNAIYGHTDLRETYKNDLSAWAQKLKPVLERNILRTKSQAEGGYLSCSGPHMSAKIAPAYLAAGKILGDQAYIDAFTNIVEEIVACMNKDPDGWIGADLSHAQISTFVVHLGYVEALRGNIPSKVTAAQLARLGDAYFLQPPYTYNGTVVPDIHHGVLAAFSAKIAAEAEATYTFDEAPGTHAYTRKFQNLAGFMMGFATNANAPLPPPALKTACATWTTKLDAGPACTHASLQAAIDAAKAGDKIIVESQNGAVCTATKAVKIAKPLTLCGKGSPEIRRTDTFSLAGSHVDGAVLHITSSDVVIEGLTLTGSEYGNVQVRNTHGIWAHGVDADHHVSNLTIRNNTLRKFRGRGISLRWVDDFIVERNAIEDVGYAGILPDESRRGLIRENKITDVNDPEACSIDPADPKKCRYVNGYPIVVSGCGNVPCSEDIIISKNVVRKNEVWVGIMNHGGHRVLIVDNEVYDTDFLYANTVSEPANSDASHKTWFVNNYGDISPPNERYPTYEKGDGMWFVGWNSPLTANVAAIGNTLLNTGFAGQHSTVPIDAVSGGRFTWNTIRTTVGSPPRYAFEIYVDDSGPPSGAHKDIVIAHNEIEAGVAGIFSKSPSIQNLKIADNVLLKGQKGLEIEMGTCGAGPWDVQGNDFTSAAVSQILGLDSCPKAPIAETVPPAPTLSATTVNQPGTVLLAWTYEETTVTPHDSFALEHKPSAEATWKKLAFRPPNDPDWKFNAPTNPEWEPYPTLRYTATGLKSGTYEFRIRANNGAAVSSWSATAKAEVP